MGMQDQGNWHARQGEVACKTRGNGHARQGHVAKAPARAAQPPTLAATAAAAPPQTDVATGLMVAATWRQWIESGCSAWTQWIEGGRFDTECAGRQVWVRRERCAALHTQPRDIGHGRGRHTKAPDQVARRQCELRGRLQGGARRTRRQPVDVQGDSQ